MKSANDSKHPCRTNKRMSEILSKSAIILRRVRPPTYRFLFLILAQKIFFVAMLFLMPALLPPLFPAGNIDSRNWERFDVSFYLDISANGYHTGSAECAFYPLW